MRQAPCPHFLDAFSDFVDDRLRPSRRMELQAHLDSCEACLRHLAAYRRGVMVYRTLESERLDEADPGALFEAVERRLWLEGHLGADVDEPETGSPAGVAWRAFGLAAAAALALLLVRPDAPLGPPTSSDGVVSTATETRVASAAPIRRASVPIEIPSEVVSGDVARERAEPRARPRAVADRSSGSAAPVRLASVGATHPVAELTVEQRLADAQSRLRRMTWQTPVSVTDGWRRPRIGGTPVVRTVGLAGPSAVATIRTAEVSPPWSVEAALVVP